MIVLKKRAANKLAKELIVREIRDLSRRLQNEQPDPLVCGSLMAADEEMATSDFSQDDWDRLDGYLNKHLARISKLFYGRTTP